MASNASKKPSELRRLIFASAVGLLVGLSIGITSTKYGLMADVSLIRAKDFAPSSNLKPSGASSPRGTGALPRGIIAPRTDLYLRRLWGNPEESMSSGIISLIPKGGDASTLQQWRPITLMSSVYKILARMITSRLRPFLPDLIHSSQTGFVQDRSILDNLVTFYEAVEWARQTGQPTTIMLLDFEKAYDRVD
ncbi:hypothetical protein L7F22_013145 [Adiantum nelumboides]|nr:hypothetical protein [Adiantum nelumboides]